MIKNLFLFAFSMMITSFCFGQSTIITLPVTFDDTNINYGLTDFGGNSSMIMADPVVPTNMVVQSTKSNTAALWAGTTVGGTIGFSAPLAFAANRHMMTMRTYSPDAGTHIRMKVEDPNNAAISVETEAITTVANAWETLTFDFSVQASGTAAINYANTYQKLSVFFNFGTDGATAGTKIYYWDDIAFPAATLSTSISLPVTFDDANINYGLTDFGGNSSVIMADPVVPTNMVTQSTKSNTAALWAGTTVGGTAGFSAPIAFAANRHTMTMRTYSPDAGTHIRMKVEDPNNAAISVETEAITTVANAWETLTFDFSAQASGTAAINYANTYQKLSVFFNFGTDGATAGTKVYYWDDIAFPPAPVSAVLDLPVTFDNAAINYGLTDFGGNASVIMADPVVPTNMVAQSTKSNTAQTWAGTTVGASAGFATAIAFAANRHTITMRTYSPDAGTHIRMKVEDPNNAAISVETEAITTVANAWETLTFDFSAQASGTAAINYANTYQKLSVFFNFGTDGATAGTKVYYWDDIIFPPAPVAAAVDLPVTFDNAAINYGLTDFGGNASVIMADPVVPTNMVAQSTKSNTAQTWAGTTVGASAGFATAIAFAANRHTITMRTYSPDAGTHVRMKVEDPNNAAISVETEAITTVANAWETLTFDFSAQASGTAAINYANTYQKLSVFFNFGTDGATAGTKVYYWDDIIFPPAPVATAVDLPVTFDNAAINYGLTDFGGNASVIMADPVVPTNMVAQSTKSNTAALWAGTTVGASAGFATAIAFATNRHTITMRTYSPDAGIPVRMKVEDPNNPAISVETEAMTTVANAWETLTFDFSAQAAGTAAINYANTYQKLSVFFNFGTDGATAGTKVYYWDDIIFPPASASNTLDLPVTFDNAAINYGLTDFGGNASVIMADPVVPTNMVAQSTKSNTAALWAGTTVGASAGFAHAIAFATNRHTITMRTYSPDAGIPVRMKVEDPNNPGISVETEAMTTVANAWETLSFDFSAQAAGTTAINYANTYQKLSVFFNFGTDGATAGTKVYYWDDIIFPPAPVAPAVDLPVTFDDAAINYGLTDFGGNASMIMADPVVPTNMVAQSTKTNTAQTWAGTTVGATAGFAHAIPFAANRHTITMRTYSPDAGIPVRMKAEDPNNPGISVETEAMTTVANAWETLTFDFSAQASGTAAINYANTYQKLSVFFNFGTDGATAGTKVYYWDDIMMGAATPPSGVNLPVTFDNTALNYDLIDFGGNASMIMADPVVPTNLVTQTIKTVGSQTWAGTTVAGTSGFTTAIPFTTNAHTLSMRIYSPDAGIPIRMKVEDPANPTISVETEAFTTTSNAWETLVFDFANQAAGTAAINYANTYQKLSVFFNFGSAGATAKTYYWDDIQFGGTVTPGGVNLPVTFEIPTVNYGLTDFGGNASTITADPLVPANHVGQSIKSNTAQTWAGTTIGGTTGFTTAIPFTTNNHVISMRVYSPDAGIHVRMKVEDPNNAGISVETEAMTVHANAWDTLVFDFANQAAGTAAINYANTYQKLSVFFNFGVDGATAGTKTYYWDDVTFGLIAPAPAGVNLPVTFDNTALNYNLIDFGGNASMIMADPVVPTNLVAQSIKTAGSQTWAGTTVGGTVGFTSPVPFAAGSTKMSMRVYSPDAGTIVRMKVEDPANGGISVETDAVTTVANAWETLVFDFANQAAGTAAINYANTYQKLSVFFNFGTGGTTAKTYYWDDIRFGVPVQPTTQQITFSVQSPDSLPVYVFGNWNNWSNFPGTPMVASGNSTYTATLTLNSSSNYEFLFVNGNTPVKEALNPADACTNGNAVNTNRTLHVGTTDSIICVQWKSCNGCVVGVVNNPSNALDVVMTADGIRIVANGIDHADQLEVFDVLGRTVFSAAKNVSVNTLIPVDLKENTFYLVRVKANGNTVTHKGIIAN